MCWDFVELRGLCQKQGIADSTVHQNALQWKLWRADYHAERAQAVWSELDQIVKAKGGIQVGGQEWQKAEFASTAETEAAAQALYSMADILAQIVNKAVLKTPLSEAEVSLSGVRDDLKEQGDAPIVVSKIESLQNSKEFKYLNAFVNTIKHQHLLDTEHRAEFGKGKRNEDGIRFKAFTYKGRSYSTVWASDMLYAYKKRMADLICAVGNAVNDYLRLLGPIV
jgi:hypothetical protein